MKSKKHLYLLFSLMIIIVFGIISTRQPLTIRCYQVKSGKITKEIRLALITDYHSTSYGENQSELAEAIQNQNPDVVLMAGDIADDVVPHGSTKQLLKAIGKEYPCYYVSGNHEYWTDDIENVKEMIRSYGVTVLEGTTAELAAKQQRFMISGIDDADIDFYSGDRQEWKKQLEKCNQEKDDALFTILLSHRPERVEEYKSCNFDLILCGHAHGGQVRIPGVLNGLFAPNQGFFPKYAGGEYKIGHSIMIVSRGLVRNKIPRVFNPPELVIIEIKPLS